MRPLVSASAVLLLLHGSSLVAAAHAHAQSAPSDAQLAEARTHYERALTLFDEGRLPASLAEFEAAYASSGRPALLYNMGSVHALMGHAVEAVDTLRRYLNEGGVIDAARREAVENEIAIQQARIAQVSLSLNVPNAEVSLDDVPIGEAPTSALRVSAGEHVISARAEGFDPIRFRFSVAGSERRAIALELSARASDAGVLELSTNVPGANVELDGHSLGLTPIEFPIGLTMGTHTLRVTRPGYREQERVVPVAASAHVVLELELVPLETPPEGVATRVELTLPSTSHTVRIDGQRASGDVLMLPYGLHDLSIEAADIEPISRRIDVPQQPLFALDPGYRWTTSGRQARLAGADSQRVNGGAIIGVGSAVLLAGAGMLIGREIMIDATGLRERQAQFALNGGPCAVDQPDLSACEAYLATSTIPNVETGPVEFQARTNNLADIAEALAVAGGVLIGVGAASVIVGAVIFGTAPSEDDIDRGATLRVSLNVSPGGLVLHGQF